MQLSHSCLPYAGGSLVMTEKAPSHVIHSSLSPTASRLLVATSRGISLWIHASQQLSLLPAPTDFVSQFHHA